MRKAMGPILTTGVALVAAAVIVANPVAPPVRDLQISTTQLSTSPEALIPFDKNLLKSIPQPSAVGGFDTALAQILGALAAEADRISSGVTSGASITPVPAAAGTGAQSFSTPAANEIPPVRTPDGAPSTSSTLSPVLSAASTPGIQQIVSDLAAADTTYLGNKVSEAAYAAVDAIVNTPNLVVKVVQKFFNGDLPAAVEAVVEAIKAFFNPGLILVGGINNIFGQLARQPNTPESATSAVATGSVETSPQSGIASAGTASSASDPQPAAVSAPGRNKPGDMKSTSGSRRAATPARLTPAPLSAAASAADQPRTRSSSSAGTPGTGNASHSAGQATSERTEPHTPGPDQPRPGSGRAQSAGGRGASASG